MNAIFDTLAYARRMESVGFTRAQAEALAEEQAKLIDERLATKADIAAVRADIGAVRADLATLREDVGEVRVSAKTDTEALRISTKAGIEALRVSTKADIEALRISTKADLDNATELLRRDLVIRLGGIVIASVAASSTLVALFGRLSGHP